MSASALVAPTRRTGVASAVGMATAVVLVATGCGGSRQQVSTAAALTSARHVTLLDAAAQVRRELRGIAQDALVLGDPRAPVTIVEYADLACATCFFVHQAVLPEVIGRYVRSGEASLEFRTVVNGTTSHNLALGAYAASSQGRGWEFVQLVYLRGAAASEPSIRLAAAVGLDVQQWLRDLRRPHWRPLIQAAASVVRVAQFTGDPVFLVRRREGRTAFIVLTEPRSVTAFGDAIARALRSPA